VDDRAGPFDVLAEFKDFEGRSVPYEMLVTRSMIVRGDGFAVHVASVDDIIAAKTFANRDKDREALPDLLDIQERERSERHEQYRSDVEFEVNDDPDRGIEP
jgi:predicted nucleotidyltransferase